MRLLLVAHSWRQASAESRTAFADQTDALLPLAGADIDSAALILLSALDALPLDELGPDLGQRFGRVLLQVSNSVGRGTREVGDRCLTLLFKFSIPLGMNGVEEISGYIPSADITRVRHVSALLAEPHYDSAARARLMRELAERALGLSATVDDVTAVFHAVSAPAPDGREAEKDALTDIIGEMVNGSDATRISLGRQLLDRCYLDIPDVRVDGFLQSVIDAQTGTTGDSNWEQRNGVLASAILERASNGMKRAVLDYFSALLTGNYPGQGKEGLISSVDRFTDEQLRSEADRLATLVNSRGPSSSHTAICDVVVRLRQWATKDALRSIEAYAANALANNDDPSVEELGHQILRGLGKVTTRPSEYLRTNLYERAAAQDGERRERFLGTLAALRPAHPRIGIWDEVDALASNQE